MPENVNLVPIPLTYFKYGLRSLQIKVAAEVTSAALSLVLMV